MRINMRYFHLNAHHRYYIQWFILYGVRDFGYGRIQGNEWQILKTWQQYYELYDFKMETMTS